MKLRYCDGASFAGDAKFDNGVSPLLVLLLSIKFMGSNILCVRGEKKDSRVLRQKCLSRLAVVASIFVFHLWSLKGQKTL